MKNDLLKYFKALHVVGILLIFFSFFVEWYSFEVYSSSGLIVSWKYNIFSEWSTTLTSTLNEFSRPENLSVSVYLTIVLAVTSVVSGYIVMFMGIESVISPEKYSIQGYVNMGLLALILFYIVFFPIMYLFPQDLYFPLFRIINTELGSTSVFTIGWGYLLLLFSFPLLFPYSFFYYRSIIRFEQEENTPEKRLVRMIQNNQEPLNLDQLIAKEELESTRTSKERGWSKS